MNIFPACISHAYEMGNYESYWIGLTLKLLVINVCMLGNAHVHKNVKLS